LWPRTLCSKVFGSGLSRCSPVATAIGSCQLPPLLLRAAVALHEPHVRAELLLAAFRATPILGRHASLQARRCLSDLGLAELLHLLGGASLRRVLWGSPVPPPDNAERPTGLRACLRTYYPPCY
jgi:hypothetical protein